MDEDVVFVTMQYRLGALGENFNSRHQALSLLTGIELNVGLTLFLGNLNTNDSAARGNQGLKDQVMAMEWIKDNIKHFGGNRRKVTIFGNSYGGMEVHAHLLSPMSKGQQIELIMAGKCSIGHAFKLVDRFTLLGLFHRAICQSGVLLFPGNFTDRSLNQNS